MKRPRRSHQCRGKRARNYVRTLARVSARQPAHMLGALDVTLHVQWASWHKHKASAATVLADARNSGALTSHRRREGYREKWAQGREHV